MTASSLLADLDTQGIRLYPEGEQLRVDAPKGLLTPELRQALTKNKADLLKALQERQGQDWGGRSLEHVMVMSADAFREAGIAVTIQSFLLGETVVLASCEAMARQIRSESMAAYLPDEIPLLDGLDPDTIRRLHIAKKIMGGTILPKAARP